MCVTRHEESYFFFLFKPFYESFRIGSRFVVYIDGINIFISITVHIIFPWRPHKIICRSYLESLSAVVERVNEFMSLITVTHDWAQTIISPCHLHEGIVFINPCDTGNTVLCGVRYKHVKSITIHVYQEKNPKFSELLKNLEEMCLSYW